MNGEGKGINRDQCLLLVVLNLALPYTLRPRKPALSVSFIKICDSVGHCSDRKGEKKGGLFGCSEGMKSPGESGDNTGE